MVGAYSCLAGKTQYRLPTFSQRTQKGNAMYPFSPSVTPAIRSHLDAQTSFLNEMSRSLSRSWQHMCELNMQLGQTMFEEGNIASQKLLTTESPADVLGAAASRAQPATDKLRAYQQHVSRVVADAQVDLARVTEERVQETSRTARDLAEQVVRAADEEMERNKRNQQQTMKEFRDPFEQQRGHGSNGSAQSHMDGQSDAHQPAFQGQSAQQTGKAHIKA